MTIGPFTITPMPADVPPAQTFSASSRCSHAAASVVYRAAALHHALIEPQPMTTRILAAIALHETARRAAFEAEQLLRDLEALREAEQAAERANPASTPTLNEK